MSLFTKERLSPGTSTFTPNAASDVPLTIQLLAGQTGDSLEVLNSSGTVLWKVDSSGAATGSGGSSISGATTITAASATALVVGPNGTTGPTFTIDSHTASAADGIKITGLASGSGAAIAVSSSTNAALTIDAAGSGTITIAGTSTGAVTITPATTITGALSINGGATVATAKTLAVTDADALTVGGVKVPQALLLSPTFFLNTSCVSQNVFTADRAYQITAINEVHTTAEATAGSLSIQVEKLTSTTAPGSGTALLTNNANAGFNAKSTANTVQAGTLTATTGNLQFASGDRIGVKFSASSTELRGVAVSIVLKAI